MTCVVSLISRSTNLPKRAVLPRSWQGVVYFKIFFPWYYMFSQYPCLVSITVWSVDNSERFYSCMHIPHIGTYTWKFPCIVTEWCRKVHGNFHVPIKAERYMEMWLWQNITPEILQALFRFWPHLVKISLKWMIIDKTNRHFRIFRPKTIKRPSGIFLVTIEYL